VKTRTFCFLSGRIHLLFRLTCAQHTQTVAAFVYRGRQHRLLLFLQLPRATLERVGGQTIMIQPLVSVLDRHYWFRLFVTAFVFDRRCTVHTVDRQPKGVNRRIIYRRETPLSLRALSGWTFVRIRDPPLRASHGSYSSDAEITNRALFKRLKNGSSSSFGLRGDLAHLSIRTRLNRTVVREKNTV
jgi:hypothetical protein